VSLVTVINHPLVQHNLAILRSKHTDQEEFRRRLAQATVLMIYEASRSFQTRPVRVSTPLKGAPGVELTRDVVVIPILRAGLGMFSSILQLIPDAHAGFIGLVRHERTLEAAIYHHSLPADLKNSETILIDPMLATGGSAVAALTLLRDRNADRVRLLNLIAAPEGIRRVHKHFPRVPIFTAAIDSHLNKKGFIVPGLGDAGDRLFGV